MENSTMEGQSLLLEPVPERAAPVERPAERVKTRELLAVLGLLVLADITIYRGQGFAGMAALFAIAPFLLHCGAPQRRFGTDVWIVGTLLIVLSAALFWCGSAWQIVIGGALLVALATTLAGMR